MPATYVGQRHIVDSLRSRSQQRRSAWMGVAGLLVLAGIVVALVAANLVAQNDSQRARSAFASSAREIASTLTLSIQHEEDLVVSARAYLVGNPASTTAQFQHWTTAVAAFVRYPELEGGGEVVLVPAAQLPAFAARKAAEPASPLSAGHPFEVLPSGRRSFYCLVALAFVRHPSPATSAPPGLDYCAADRSLSTAFLTARDSGRNSYIPYRSGPTEVLTIEAPVYRGGGVPGTVAARRAGFLGAFGTTVVPSVLLQTAVRSHPGIAVEFRYGGASSAIAFRSGAAARGGHSATVRLGYGWTMTASGNATSPGVLADSKAEILLIAGTLVSVLLGLLVFVLGTGRARAVAMVGEKTKEISYRALHDTLTGLPNRALVLDRAERMLARAGREPSGVPAALYIDIDRFKDVNDTFGHAAGDRLLQIVAERLRSVVRDQDTVGRLSGDEFVVLLESATRHLPPELVAERVIAALRRPMTLEQGSRPFAATVSVGIATGVRSSADELLRDADLALYTAKAAGKNRAVLFHASMQNAAATRRRLEVELDEALEGRQFFLLYQPIVDLRSNGVLGVEALIRWQHPERGVVAPDEFIPFSEETGQIMAIGRWVLQEACRQSAEWAADGHPMSISVNVSAYQLDRDELPQDVLRALQSSGIEPSSLTLEITETALMRDVSGAASRLRGVRELGVRVALDDLGTGSSALAYLRAFAPDALKIDRSFIAGMNGSMESAAIIRTLVELGKLLQIDTLAEGIEEPEQLAQLIAANCEQGQGFLFAEPLAAEELERYLSAHAGERGAGTTA
jgi:diguanylate cyclase (GGDEF)-like protein